MKLIFAILAFTGQAVVVGNVREGMEAIGEATVKSTKEIASAMRHAADQIEKAANHATDEFASVSREGIREGANVARETLRTSKDIVTDLRRTTKEIVNETNLLVDRNMSRFESLALRLGNIAQATTERMLSEMSGLVTMMTQETRGGVSEFVALGRTIVDMHVEVMHRGLRCVAMLAFALLNVATFGANFDRHQIANTTQIISSVGTFLSALWWMQQDYQDAHTLQNEIRRIRNDSVQSEQRLRNQHATSIRELEESKYREKENEKSEIIHDMEDLRRRDNEDRDGQINQLRNDKQELEEDLARTRQTLNDNLAAAGAETTRVENERRRVRNIVTQEIEKANSEIHKIERRWPGLHEMLLPMKEREILEKTRQRVRDMENIRTSI